MADISSISGAASRAYQASASARAHQASTSPRNQARITSATRESDLFEVSDAAHFLAKLKSMPEVRQDVVDRAREQIRNGQIDTPEKLEAALEEMINDYLDRRGR